jgi:hypothetical protein
MRSPVPRIKIVRLARSQTSHRSARIVLSKENHIFAPD